MKGFNGYLDTRLVKDNQSGLFQLLSPFGFTSDVAGVTINVPVGFTTDFCSVPRVPFAFELLGNRARKSGTVHDWLYTSHMMPRNLADEVLREMLLMPEEVVDHFEAMSFYLAVRAGGGSHWGPDPVVSQ